MVNGEDSWCRSRLVIAAAVLLGVVSASSCMPVTHGDPPPPPARIVVTPAASGPAPLTVHFDGSTSGGPGLPVSDYWWYFDDGSDPQAGPVVDHTFSASGSYTVVLNVHSDYSPFPGETSVVITAG